MSSDTSPTLTAERIYHGSKPKVHLYADGVEIAALGGTRAGRAQAVIVTQWGTKPLDAWGLRQDLHAAQVEATRLVTATSMRTRGRFGIPGSTIPLNRPNFADAVPVTDPATPNPTTKESNAMTTSHSIGAPRTPKPKVASAPSATANHTKPGGAAKVASARKTKVQANADKVAAINARRDAEAAQVAERVEQAKARLAASPVQPAEGKVERMQLASAEAKALKAWQESGEQGERPSTANLDAIEAKEPARKATAAAKATHPRKQATASVVPTEGQQNITCKGACGKAKPITKFPTVGGGKRGTECRECRDARRGKVPAAKAS